MSNKVIVTVLVLLVLVFSLAFGQALESNPDYKKAKDLQAKANKALADGDYDASYRYAEEAKQYMAKAQLYANELAPRYRATNWLALAKERLGEAQDMDAEDRYPEELAQAVDNYAEAQIAFNNGKWEESIEYSKNVIAWLANIQPAPREEPVEEPVEVPEELVFPKYYVVRLIPEDRDCFNKISGYPFVYNDKYKWRILYEANKDKIRYPDNPHLIHPGQVFEIPSLWGEKREGTWDPDLYWPTLE
jgi:nucleoid-associated protein YgaU